MNQKEVSYQICLSRKIGMLIISTLITACGSGSDKPEQPQLITIHTTAGPGGRISPDIRNIQIGQNTSFTIIAEVGYNVANVSGCEGVLNGNTYTTGYLNNTCTVTAFFNAKSYIVEAIAGPGGRINANSQIVNHGGTISFTITSEFGFSIASVTGCNGTLKGNIYTIDAVTSACTVSASFNPNTYTVTAIASEGGTITPGSVSLKHGQSHQFSVVAMPNYRIATVTGCSGTLIGETYTTSTITNDCTINARFAFVSLGGINDTGIDWCANGNSNDLSCPVVGFEGQDAQYGRDAKYKLNNLKKIGSGSAGFDYTKIAADGSVLPIQNKAWKVDGNETDGSQWSCVRDNVNGLIWEVKSINGLRDMKHTYSWYNPDSASNGGDSGAQNGNTCSGIDCNTNAFIQAVNSQGLCGTSNWRMPTRHELIELIHNGRFSPAIDRSYFPNTPNNWFWTSSSSFYGTAWVVDFDNGTVARFGKGNSVSVRLVSSGQ